MSRELSTSSGWMVVYVAGSQPEAHVIRGMLETNGVPSWIMQEPVGSALGLTIGSLGEVRVLVHPRDYDRALALLEDEPDEEDALDFLSDADEQ